MLNFKKSEENTIDVPTPQSLSQRTPTSSPLKTSFSTSVSIRVVLGVYMYMYTQMHTDTYSVHHAHVCAAFIKSQSGN